MTCAHLSDKGTPCGRPAVATWEHPVTGSWPLCRRHDLKAQGAVLTEGLRAFAGWHRLPLAPQAAPQAAGAPEAQGVA